MKTRPAPRWGPARDELPDSLNYLQPAKVFRFDKCITLIMLNGDVVTCRDYIDVKVRNITEKGLLKIWNDEGFVRFRALLPQCTRCCGLMGF
jgi:hypothetical protein